MRERKVRLGCRWKETQKIVMEKKLACLLISILFFFSLSRVLRLSWATAKILHQRYTLSKPPSYSILQDFNPTFLLPHQQDDAHFPIMPEPDWSEPILPSVYFSSFSWNIWKRIDSQLDPAPSTYSQPPPSRWQNCRQRNIDFPSARIA